jgi:hypothetical protein
VKEVVAMEQGSETAKTTKKRKTDRESFMESITVHASDCEEMVLVPVRLLNSWRDEIASLRAVVEAKSAEASK